MENGGFNIDGLIDLVAERVAMKLAERLGHAAGPSVKRRLLTVEEGGVYLGRTKEAIEHMIAAGKLPVVRADRRVFLDMRDLDYWVEQNKTKGLH